MIELGSRAGIRLKSNIRIAQQGIDSDNPDHNATPIKRIPSRRSPKD
jgi:hypothetical protein